MAVLEAELEFGCVYLYVEWLGGNCMSTTHISAAQRSDLRRMMTDSLVS